MVLKICFYTYLYMRPICWCIYTSNFIYYTLYEYVLSMLIYDGNIILRKCLTEIEQGELKAGSSTSIMRETKGMGCSEAICRIRDDKHYITHGIWTYRHKTWFILWWRTLWMEWCGAVCCAQWIATYNIVFYMKRKQQA